MSDYEHVKIAKPSTVRWTARLDLANGIRLILWIVFGLTLLTFGVLYYIDMFFPGVTR